MISELMSQGYQEHEAAEVALPLFILLKPEDGAEEDPEMAQERADKDARLEAMRWEPPQMEPDR